MRTASGHDAAPGLAWAESVLGPIDGVRELLGGQTSTMLAVSARGSAAPCVLRLITEEPWRSHGESLATRESQVQQILSHTPVPAPLTVALDADGLSCGFPAHLMTFLPGEVELSTFDDRDGRLLAEALATIHDMDPAVDVRDYESWAWPEKFQAPRWARDPEAWDEAFDILRPPPPASPSCFLHRDFQPHNVLWQAGRITGVVDWVETSIGPAALDVAHCCTNLAFLHGQDAATSFARAYVEVTGRELDPYFDVMDIVGFLPPPGKAGWFDDDEITRGRLEERLRLVIDAA